MEFINQLIMGELANESKNDIRFFVFIILFIFLGFLMPCLGQCDIFGSLLAQLIV